MSAKELQLREEHKLYPPRFAISIRRSSAAKNSHMVFTFEGATEKIVKNIMITGISCY